MTKFRILVPDSHSDDLEIERALSGDRFEYVVFNEVDPARIPDEEWGRCDALLVWHRMRIDAATIARLERCRMVVRVGVGFDNVDDEACTRAGIPLCNTPSYGTTEVADHAMALLLHLVRGLGTYEARLRASLVDGFVAEGAPVVRRLRGSTFGAIGMGRIGTAAARRAAGFDMDVVYYDPYHPDGHELGLGFRRVRSLQALMEQSDVVSLHTPLSASTRNILDARAFAASMQDQIVINIARGGLIDLDALHDAMRGGRIAAAGLDVFPEEPLANPPKLVQAWRDREPWLDGRLVLSPHAAFFSEAGYHDIHRLSAEVVTDYLLNGHLRNNVNPGWKGVAEVARKAVA